VAGGSTVSPILLSFCVLPSVSQAIFDTCACESFELSAGESISYMRSDLTVECGGAEHDALAGVSYAALMVLWPIGVPLSTWRCCPTQRMHACTLH
jgi:hypothetical protein